MNHDIKKAVQASTDARHCFVCGRVIANAQGVYDVGLRILTHQGVCTLAVDAQQRVYDRSRRGRWRPRHEVLQRLYEARLTEGRHTSNLPSEEAFKKRERVFPR